MAFSCSDSFASFALLKEAIRNYEDTSFIKLWVRDARTIEAARKSIPIKAAFMAADIKYYFIKYCCIHGGQKFKYCGKGKRKTSTFKKDCPFYLNFKASEDGQFLVLHAMNNTHNHEVSEILYKHLPNSRKLPDYAIEKAKELMHLKPNKKLLQKELIKSTGKIITLRDLSNIAASSKKVESRNDITTFVTTLKEKYSESEVAAVGLITNEDAASLSWFVETFKKNNCSWSKTNAIITDKDLNERDVLRASFPDASLLLCLFHTLRTFNREISTVKLGITSGQRTSCLELIQKLAYARSETQYNEFYDIFVSLSPTTVLEYFNNNWHNIRNEWVFGLNYACANFMNTTNNRLENFNGKLKEVIDCNSTLENFLENLYVLLASMRNERDHKTIFKMQKICIDFFEPNSVESEYKNILTTYAFEQVLKQFSLHSEVNLFCDNENYIVKSSEGMLIVTSDSCGCMFRKSMGLPCRHIFAVRQLLGLNLFDAKLCLERWTIKYYRQHQRVFNTSSETKESCVQISVAPRKKTILSQHEKFKLALRTTSLLATLVSESTGPSFEQRMGLLQELQKGWEHGKVMVLNELIETDLGVSDIVSNQTFSDAGAPNDVDLIEILNKEEGNEIDFRNVSSEEYVTINNLQQNQEKCFVVQDKAGLVDTQLKKICLPQNVVHCGRPKGATHTTIGLPKKRLCRSSDVPVPFIKLEPAKRHALMLGWFLKADDVQKALSGTLINKSAVEKRPNCIPSSILDESALELLSSLQIYFSSDAWKALDKVIKAKKNQHIWPCAVCLKSTSEGNKTGNAIACDSCLLWSHKKCVGQKENSFLKARNMKCQVLWFTFSWCISLNKLQKFYTL
ncbi:uncharacterized protein LOC124816845 isoform X2 [Hydra vulgaris]|uniref:uncharacterized protein LOC105845879 isoform X2 n=1 Tax=Hydra vulgaris TaxID=6087 RepID=UPI0032EA560F